MTMKLLSILLVIGALVLGNADPGSPSLVENRRDERTENRREERTDERRDERTEERRDERSEEAEERDNRPLVDSARNFVVDVVDSLAESIAPRQLNEVHATHQHAGVSDGKQSAPSKGYSILDSVKNKSFPIVTSVKNKLKSIKVKPFSSSTLAKRPPVVTKAPVEFQGGKSKGVASKGKEVTKGKEPVMSKGKTAIPAAAKVKKIKAPKQPKVKTVNTKRMPVISKAPVGSKAPVAGKGDTLICKGLACTTTRWLEVSKVGAGRSKGPVMKMKTPKANKIKTYAVNKAPVISKSKKAPVVAKEVPVVVEKTKATKASAVPSKGYAARKPIVAKRMIAPKIKTSKKGLNCGSKGCFRKLYEAPKGGLLRDVPARSYNKKTYVAPKYSPPRKFPTKRTRVKAPKIKTRPVRGLQAKGACFGTCHV
eukprot:Selendium_serpulae@DN5404_c0_g1_i1.p1